MFFEIGNGKIQKTKSNKKQQQQQQQQQQKQQKQKQKSGLVRVRVELTTWAPRSADWANGPADTIRLRQVASS